MEHPRRIRLLCRSVRLNSITCRQSVTTWISQFATKKGRSTPSGKAICESFFISQVHTMLTGITQRRHPTPTHCCRRTPRSAPILGRQNTRSPRAQRRRCMFQQPLSPWCIYASDRFGPVCNGTGQAPKSRVWSSRCKWLYGGIPNLGTHVAPLGGGLDSDADSTGRYERLFSDHYDFVSTSAYNGTPSRYRRSSVFHHSPSQPLYQ